MTSARPEAGAPLAVTGLGAACGLGHGTAALLEGLLAGRDVFGVLARPGRQAPDGSSRFLGVEMPDPPSVLPPRLARTVGLPGLAAAAVVAEAWHEAGLDAVAPERVGLVVGGSNLMGRDQVLAARRYGDRPAYVPPRHAHAVLDTDLCGVLCAAFPVRGFAHTVGAASASGAVAVLEAAAAVRAGRVDACIAVGALQDPSWLDLQALTALGAMGSSRFADAPGRACRPMDADHDGFLYGEASAALVVQRAEEATAAPCGLILGGAEVVDGQRGPEPDTAAQVRAARLALEAAGLTAADIDTVNGHATGTPRGDWAELETYRTLGLRHARINATKSVIGHGLAAAGAIEIAAVLLQMRAGRLHPTRNLDTPLDADFRWVRGEAADHAIRRALKLSFGFGGINTALVLGAPDHA
ncbi:beta-ketoacyl synthase N-terminal-like domain-containing protein [Roseospira navarrensis]|uniref:Polyketide beta-ketoacyl:ACP synthase n=1 Tax=Roseospira navarrensis TaxID=140058 RepID=A0A7X1ZCW4_9PROT|nr:beta-ketoacyl synthase N-terminal-like domain-containing protein [Roseospira navarrensis]MQX35689.1 polyketide beta-ketoacyl:ACP synthase [Roseospira navarrensis]